MIQFHDDALNALKDLGADRMATMQELADEAFDDLLRKHKRPVGLRQSLKRSASEGKRAGDGPRESGVRARRA